MRILMALLFSILQISSAFALIDINSETAQHNDFPLNGIYYGPHYPSENRTQACFSDENVCLQFYPAAEPEVGASCEATTLLNRVGSEVGYDNMTERALVGGFVRIQDLDTFSRAYGQYPRSTYVICKSGDESTYGAFCLGPQEGKLEACALVIEFREERRPHVY